jgi:hypothetical protein
LISSLPTLEIPLYSIPSGFILSFSLVTNARLSDLVPRRMEVIIYYKKSS